MGNICYNSEESKKRSKYNGSVIKEDSIMIEQIQKEEILFNMPNFINKPINYDQFYDKVDIDEIFNLQKRYEKKELNNFFESNESKIKNEFDSTLNATTKNIIEYVNERDIHKLISDIIYLENGNNIYSEKIKFLYLQNQKYEANNNLNTFKRMNIIVCGKSGVGKTSLIFSILNKQLGQKNISRIIEYQNDENPFFKFAEMYCYQNGQTDINNSKKIISDYINQQYQTNDINNYVNCIWYCFSQGYLEFKEIELINSLNDLYNKTIPIILVHTKTINIGDINKTNNLNINKDNLVFVLSRDFGNIKSYGLHTLINKTLDKWKSICLLKNERTKFILSIIKSDNKNKHDLVLEENKKQFINNYNLPKNTEDFIQYIANIFQLNIKYYLTKVMNKESKNRIINENFLIKPIRDFINLYEQNSRILIEPVIDSYILNFMNYQKEIQKQKNININPKNIRNSEQMKYYIKIYLYNNYKYIMQKHFIYNVLFQKYGFFCDYFQKELDYLSEQIIFNLDNSNFQNKIFENNIKNFYGINNINYNINNQISTNTNKNYNAKNDNDSILSSTIIDGNNINQNMNLGNDYNFSMRPNNYINNNNNNLMNNINFNNINNMNFNYNNQETTMVLPSKTEVELNSKETEINKINNQNNNFPISNQNA